MMCAQALRDRPAADLQGGGSKRCDSGGKNLRVHLQNSA